MRCFLNLIIKIVVVYFWQTKIVFVDNQVGFESFTQTFNYLKRWFSPNRDLASV